MEALKTLNAVAAPIEGENVDTDRIIPARLLRLPRDEKRTYANSLFHDLRFNEDGSEIADFVLNQEPWRDARILVAGPNFGCGSSRESAVYALLDLGMAIPEPTAIRWVLLGGLGASAVLIAVELASHGSRHVELAVAAMTRGRYARQFWWGGVIVGLVVPALLVIIALAADIAGPALPAAAAVAALAGMFAYEDAFVRAGQSVPLS